MVGFSLDYIDILQRLSRPQDRSRYVRFHRILSSAFWRNAVEDASDTSFSSETCCTPRSNSYVRHAVRRIATEAGILWQQASGYKEPIDHPPEAPLP